VSAPLGLSRAHWKERLGAIEGLNLRLLVHAQNHGFLGRIEVKPHDVADLLDFGLLLTPGAE
jgi:hypothetical protein